MRQFLDDAQNCQSNQAAQVNFTDPDTLTLEYKMSKKVLVIGLDGVPCSVLRDLAARGVMPNVRDLSKRGVFGEMEVSLPPLSSVSWSSFMTGRGPAQHGIYGFTDITSDYRIQFNSFLDLRASTLFDRLGEKGKNSVVINLPSTYPVRKFPGVLVAGFVALDLERSVYPSTFLPFCQRIGYEVDIDLLRARQDKEFLFRELRTSLRKREQVADYLWESEKWDLFMLVITGTDRLQHFAFSALVEESDPWREEAFDYYHRVDQLIGKYVDRFLTENDGLVVLLSDHGFTSLRKEVYLNALLQEHGFLSFKTDEPEMISQLDPARTRAFVLDPGRVYINREGRFQKGIVKERECDSLLADLKELFFSYTCEGEKVIKDIRMKSDIYEGPFLHVAPDMVLLPVNGFDLKGAVTGKGVCRTTDLQGMHTHDDAFYLLYAADFSRQCDVRQITDLTEIIENWLS